MERRKFGTVALVFGLAGCSEQIPDSVPGAGGDSASTDGKSFGPLSPGFESIEWINLNVLRVNFNEDHQMDFFTINHEYRGEYDDAIYVEEAPDFGGQVDYPLIDEIQNSETVYPTRTFTLHAYQGESGFITSIEEDLGSVSFTVPETIAPSESFE